jgi:transcriptional regulator with XRE-family HTH domain
MLEFMSSMAEDLNQRIAQRVRELRAASGLTMEELAACSGVSRSMISLIERGESSPTAVVLERLAAGLGVALVSLFDAPGADAQPVARRADQPQWRDPGSGYVRRNVSPPGFPSPIQISKVELPAGAYVTFETGVRDVAIHQQVWVLEGAIEVSVGDEQHTLQQGDCLAMVLDRPTAFHNRTRKAARYAVVIVSESKRAR